MTPASFWRRSPDLFCVLDGEGRFIELNPAWQTLLGWDVDRLLGTLAADIAEPVDAVETRVRCADGSDRWFLWSSSRVGARQHASGKDTTAARDAEAAVLLNAGRVDSLVLVPDHGVCLLGASGTVREASGQLCSLVGYDADELLGLTGSCPFWPGDASPLLAQVLAGTRVQCELLLRRRDGSRLAAVVDLIAFDPGSAVEATILCVVRPLTFGADSVAAGSSALDATRATVLLQARLLDAVDAAVVATDDDGIVTHWNQGAERIYGWTAAEATGRHVTQLVIGEPEFAAFEAERQDAPELGLWESQFDVRDKNGVRFPVFVRSARLVDDQLRPAGFVTVSVDVSARVDAETRERSTEGYLRAVTDSMGEGVFTVDPAGRVIYLNAAAERMLGWRRSDLVGERAGPALMRGATGDAFAFAPDERAHARTGPSKAISVDDKAFMRRDGTEFPVQYTTSPFTTTSGVEGKVVVFSDITDRKLEEQRVSVELESLGWVYRIRDALDQGRFWLAAQPIIDVGTRAVVQHELLIRMRDQGGRTVPPGQFLPAAEASGLIRDIDLWVLAEGIALAGRGHPVQINISAASLGSPALFGAVQSLLDLRSANPRLVVFEVTETALLEHEAVAQTFIERVAELGCRVALDDFGTGYGGFTYLKRLPVHYLKIDREFVRDLSENAASRHVVAAVVALARGFGQETVAEGVEQRSTMRILAGMGVDLAQGYALGRPAPVERVFGLVEPARVA